MPMTRMPAVLMMLLALAAGAVAPGDAVAGNRGRGGDSAFADRAISLDEAVAQAERRYNARAIRAEEKRHGDRIEYRIRLLGADGRVFEVRIDAGTGRRED